MKPTVAFVLVVSAGTIACSGAAMPAPAAQSVTTPTRAVDPNDFTYLPGVTQFPWSHTEKYRAAAADGTEDLFVPGFPAESREIVRFCEHCKYVDVNIMPERGTHLLKINDFKSGVLRVVARVELKDIINAQDPSLQFDSVTVLTGLARVNDRAYLVVISNDRAAFMFNSGGRIAFTIPWTFDPEDHHAMGRAQARWKRREDRLLLGVSREHLAGAWLSCAEGCCNASPM